ncbi:hypothetical protein BJY01DRAFT_249287 [Aspergillus pseudoustus]|uniref:phospholipase A2 n=1 Tax=Aspergillus pseudoustus TaxID=1810923 RepID=A0ABR4JSV7_9EURO
MKEIDDEGAQRAETKLEPWQVFDMIGGTSTGGILAIMLGRLRMSLDECEEAYISLSREIFTPRPRPSYIPFHRPTKILDLNGRFDAKVMENTVKAQIARKGFVVSVRENNTKPAIIRSYKHPQAAEALFNECKAWEAARATSAATTFFDPITIGKKGQRFINGGLLYNNPVRLVQQEANDIWPGRDSLLISIGTGEAPHRAFAGGILKVLHQLTKLATETEETANQFYLSHPEMVDAERYFRFNVTHGLAEVKLEEYQQTGKIADATESYLDTGEANRKFKRCVMRLLEIEDEVSLNVRLHERLEEMSAVDRLAVMEWFSPLDFAQRQKDLLVNHQPGTGLWLFDASEFQAWRQKPREDLWLHGIPGAGKSTLVSMVIDCLQAERDRSEVPDSTGISWIYCSSDTLTTGQALKDLTAALWRGLAAERSELSPSVVSIYNKNRFRGSRPGFNEIIKALNAEIKRLKQVYLLMDAVDECPESVRYQIVELLQGLARNNENVRVLCTTRPHLSFLFDDKVNLEIRATEKDMRLFLTAEMATYDPDFQRMVDRRHVGEGGEQETLREYISRTIVQRAENMFLLARLHLESLKGEVTVRGLRARLAEVPKGDIKKTYDLAMARIEQQSASRRETAFQILSWVLFSQRPLTVPELLHSLAVNPGDEAINAEGVLSNEESLIQYCAGLLTIDQGSRIIRIVHPTAIEYFDRVRPDGTKTEKEIRFPEAQHELATKCLTYLLFRVFSSGPCPADRAMETRIRDNSLVLYAAKHWGHHAQGNAIPATIEKLVLELLVSETENMACAVQAMFVPPVRQKPGWSQAYPKQVEGLWLAAYFGLTSIVELLVDTMGADLQNGHATAVQYILARTKVSGTGAAARVDFVNYKGETELHVAAAAGHVEVVRSLLESGANINARSMGGRTALMLAADNGNTAVVDLLLSRRADHSIEDDEGSLALDLAAWSGHNAIVQLLLMRMIGQPTLQHSWSRFNWALEEHLRRAVLRGRKQDMGNVQDLLQRMIPEMVSSHSDLTYSLALSTQALEAGLGWAAEEGRFQFVQVFVRYGVDVDSITNGGKAALHRAAQGGHGEVVQFLLECGADISLRDEYFNQTALNIAASHGYARIKEILIEHGADPIDAIDTRSRLTHADIYKQLQPEAAGNTSGILGTEKQLLDIEHHCQIDPGLKRSHMHWA